MKIKHIGEVKAEDLSNQGAKNATIQWLIKEEDGAKNFAMRYFVLKKNGETPYHSHNWEHEVFIIKGKCEVCIEDTKKTVSENTSILVPQDKKHNFKNAGDEDLIFLCMIPIIK